MASRDQSQGWEDDSSQDARGDAAQNYPAARGDGVPFRASQAGAVHIMNGETHFPTAMSYASDAQRSDVATVCSGSVADDIEVESVFSQDDNHHRLHGSGQASPAHFLNPTGLAAKRGSGVGRVVEFSDAPSLHTGVPGGFRRHSDNRSLSLHDMGPPLSRTLLLQKNVDGISSRPSSVRSFGSHTGSDGATHPHSDDCGGSLDVEAQSEQERWDPNQSSGVALSAEQTQDHGQINTSHGSTPANSVKSYGSQASEGAHDTDDCGGSMDVETHSVGTRSIHSQEDTHSAAILETKETEPRGSPTPKLNLGMVSSEVDGINGRVSPGGTIYRGRGVRRYKGRYMHLPLKRFHQNGIDLDAVPADAAVYDPRRNEETDQRRSLGDQWGRHSTFYVDERNQRRSRSRSRSPEDRKPPARRRSRSPKLDNKHSHREDNYRGDSGGTQSPSSRGHWSSNNQDRRRNDQANSGRRNRVQVAGLPDNKPLQARRDEIHNDSGQEDRKGNRRRKSSRSSSRDRQG